MDIEYYRQMEPFFGSWTISKALGEGSYGKVFEIVRTDFGKTYHAALKVITLPRSESEVKSLIAEGMDEVSVTAFYKGLVEEVAGEFALMADLKGNSNIVSYEDHMVREHKDGVGWDILIRMELLTPLVDRLSQGFLPEIEVVKLGIDICRALEDCQKKCIIHRDIKPENIFISDYGTYKLGDFGVARTVERTTSNMSKKGTYTYMAPEIYKDEPYGASVDTYSLGLVLYRLLNKHRAPFLPEYPKPIGYADKENAISRRMAGELIPKPADMNEDIWWIIRRATAYSPSDRYAGPTEMRRDLERVLEVFEGGAEPYNFRPIPVPGRMPTNIESINEATEVTWSQGGTKVKAKHAFTFLWAFIFIFTLFKLLFFNSEFALKGFNAYTDSITRFILSLIAFIPPIIIGIIQLISYLKGKGKFSPADKLILFLAAAENAIGVFGILCFSTVTYGLNELRFLVVVILTFIAMVLSIVAGYAKKNGLRIATLVLLSLGCLIQLGSGNGNIVLTALLVALLEFRHGLNKKGFADYAMPIICTVLSVLLFIFESTWIDLRKIYVLGVFSIVLLIISVWYLVYTIVIKHKYRKM